MMGKFKLFKEFPRPRTVKEVKSFLGLVNYYRKHLKNLAIVARPLTALTRKNMPTNWLDWTSECEEAFVKVKELLTSRGGSRNFRRGFPLVVDPRHGGLGTQPPEADNFYISKTVKFYIIS